MKLTVLDEMRAELVALADEKTKASAASFFKETVKFHGVKTAEVSRLARLHYKAIQHLSKSEIFLLCEELFKTGYNEEAFIACDWVYRLKKSYTEKDFSTFEGWVDHYIDNWAKCDTFCNHSVGALVEGYPQLVENLKKWARSNNQWLRRAAAVSLILPARRGGFLGEVFQISDILMQDREDMVQKGYGWLLKEASRCHRQEVFDYVMKYREILPRTAFRYAIEKMPVELRALAMSKNK